MRVFFDANVVLSALGYDGIPRRIWRCAVLGTIEGILSEQVIEEVMEHLPDVTEVFPEEEPVIERILRTVCMIVPVPDVVAKVCRDPDDDAILAAAAFAKADVLVTGDQDLLVLGAHEDVEIIRPAEFLKRIGIEKPA